MSKILLLGLPLRRGDIHAYGKKARTRFTMSWDAYDQSGTLVKSFWGNRLSQRTTSYDQVNSMQQYFLDNPFIHHYGIRMYDTVRSFVFISSSNIGRVEQIGIGNPTEGTEADITFHLYDIDFYKDAFLEVDVM